MTETTDKPPLYTVGHGSRTLEDFLELLRRYRIRYVIDVRSAPYSRFQPDFSRPSLENRLAEAGIRYVFMGQELGGIPNDPTVYVNGKVDYDAYRGRPEYPEGIRRLKVAWEKVTYAALLCSELDPERCHRSKLIGATLTEQNIPLAHIDRNGDLKTQEEVMGPQLRLFDGLTSRKRYEHG